MATVCSQIVAGKSSGAAPIEVRMWVREAQHLAEMEKARENRRYLPGVKLAENLRLLSDEGRAI